MMCYGEEETFIGPNMILNRVLYIYGTSRDEIAHNLFLFFYINHIMKQIDDYAHINVDKFNLHAALCRVVYIILDFAFYYYFHVSQQHTGIIM